jgi:hypothetical protein
MSAAIAPVKSAPRTYVIELGLVAILYAAAAWGRPWLAAHANTDALKLAARLVPIVPVWLLPIVVWRYYRRIDELAKKQMLEVLAISFGIASSAIISYAFLMDVGFPALGITWAWPVLAITVIAVRLIQRFAGAR